MRSRSKNLRRSVSSGIILLFLVVVLLPLAYAADETSYNISVPETITLTGSGDYTMGPFDVVEGTLVFHIKTRTDCQSCAFILDIQQDNNLDGIFCGEGDGYCGGVYSAGYEDITNLDTTTNFSSYFYGGKINLVIDNVGTFDWEVKMEQQPWPRHTIAGGVGNYIQGARIMAVDANGNEFITETDEWGDYALSVFGFTDYAVTASAPGYSTVTKMVGSGDFLSLGYPSWNVKVNFDLQLGGSDSLIYCKVKDKSTQQSIKGTTVTVFDASGKQIASKTADTNGIFSFENLDYSTYKVTASADGYADVTKQIPAVSSSTVEVVSFEMDVASARIYGYVNDSFLGHPVENITVYLNDRYNSDIFAEKKTDKSGYYSFSNIEPGKYSVQAGNLYDTRFKPSDSGKITTIEKTQEKRVDLVVEPNNADLAVTVEQRFNVSDVPVGKILDHSFVVSNVGPQMAKAVNLTVTISSKDVADVVDMVEFFSIKTSKGTYQISGDKRQVVFSLGDIPKNGIENVNISLRAKKVGNFTISALVADTSYKDWRKVDWVLENNEVSASAEVFPVEISGQVMSFSPSIFLVDIPVPLKNIPVNILLDDGRVNYTVHSDDKGRYSLKVNRSDNGTFQMEASLKDKNNILVINSEKGFNKRVVKLKTKKFSIERKNEKKNILFTPFYRDLDASMTQDQKSILRDAGVYYFNNYEAVLFTKNKLKVNLNHKLPVDVYLYSSNAGTYYLKSDSHINVEATGKSSSVLSLDTPDNREYHEFGHHVNADSQIGGENTYPNRTLGDTNHGGVDNSNTNDSFVEGFAEFFSLMVKGNTQYRWIGTVTDLQKNHHVLGTSSKPDEEFNVASLLWDIVDKDAEKGDNVSLGIENTWKVLNSTDVTNVRSLYLALNKSIGKQDTNKNDNVSDVDALFILHRFYYDVNRNGKWDTNESVGYADSYNGTVVASPRSGRPRVEGTGLDFSVLDDNGNMIDANLFNVSVYFPENEYDLTYQTWPDPENGYLWVVVPGDSLKVEIIPLTPGYATEPLVLEPAGFWENVMAAQQENKDTYATHEFIATDNGVEKPLDFRAETVNGTSIRLTWDYDGNVALVRGIGSYPVYPDDIMTIYHGDNNEYTDTGLFTDMEYYYSLFGVVDGDVSKGVMAKAKTVDGYTQIENVVNDTEETKGNGIMIFVSVIILLSAIMLLKKRKKF